MSILTEMSRHPISDQVGRAVAWWLSELHSLRHDAARRLVALAGRNVTIEAGEPRWIIRRGTQRLGEIDWNVNDEPTGRQALYELLASNNRSAGIEVAIPPECLLSKIVSLPAAARSALNRIVAFEIARHFPFPAERVFYHHRIVGSSSGVSSTPGTLLSVEIVVVSRDVVLSIAERLTAAGLRIGSIVLATSAGDVPLSLPPDARLATARSASRRWIAVAVVLTGLLAALSWPLAQQFRLAAIEREVATLQPAAEVALRARQAQQRALDQMGVVSRLLAERPPLIGLLDMLSRDLPDGSWLTALSISGHDALLEGLSPSAAAIALALGRDPNFIAISFRSPIARDGTGDLEHFQLGATITEPRR